MESMVREGLASMGKEELNNKNASAFGDIICCVLMLAAIPNYDIHPLTKECLQSQNEWVFHILLTEYIKNKSLEPIPFLYELLEEESLKDKYRLVVCRALESFVEPLKRQEKHEEAAKIIDVVKEVKKVKMMENVVRESLIIIKEKVNIGPPDIPPINIGQSTEYNRASRNLYYCMQTLAALPDYNIHPLLKECFQSNDERVFRQLISYIQVNVMDAIPFLRELVEEVNLSVYNRSSIYRELEKSIELLSGQGKNDDVEKINAFLKEVREKEQAKKEAEQTEEEPENPPPTNTDETE